MLQLCVVLTTEVPYVCSARHDRFDIDIISAKSRQPIFKQADPGIPAPAKIIESWPQPWPKIQFRSWPRPRHNLPSWPQPKIQSRSTIADQSQGQCSEFNLIKELLGLEADTKLLR